MKRAQEPQKRSFTATQNVLALALIGGLLLTGFFVEEMRILNTRASSSMALPSFVGYPHSLGLALVPIRWEVVYPYGWYIHAVFCAMLIAYLPFSKMFHILVSPLVLVMNALAKEE